MSVIVYDMDEPKTCSECDFCIKEYPDRPDVRTCLRTGDRAWDPENSRNEDCPVKACSENDAPVEYRVDGNSNIARIEIDMREWGGYTPCVTCFFDANNNFIEGADTKNVDEFKEAIEHRLSRMAKTVFGRPDIEVIFSGLDLFRSRRHESGAVEEAEKMVNWFHDRMDELNGENRTPIPEEEELPFY